MKKMIQVIQDDSGSGKLLFQKPYVKIKLELLGKEREKRRKRR